MTDVTGVASLSKEELKRQLALIEAQEKAAAAQQGAEMVEMAEDSGFLAWLVDNSAFKRTESTGRYGADYMTVPFVHNGRTYTVSIHVTDVVETEQGKARVKAAAKAAEALAAAQARNATLDALINEG